MTTEDKGRGLDAKDGLEHGEQRKRPDDRAHDVDEDRRLGHPGRVQRALEAVHHHTLDEQRDAHDDGKVDDLPDKR
jgi:hypothetical protein